jgi:hypothetical protein
MTDQKSIARTLDRAAARADMIDREPATGKQVWFLAGLIAKAGKDAGDIDCGCLNTQAILTKRMASEFIAMYLADQTKAA